MTLTGLLLGAAVYVPIHVFCGKFRPNAQQGASEEQNALLFKK